jgi:L-threonylcarbamoyladenylate synthase
MPTDTLYALTASASDAEAVRRVFAIKRRELTNPLPLFVSGLAMAERIGVFDARSRSLARRFWPGQLTIVVRTQPGFESEALGGGATVGLRVPDSDIARAVIDGLGQPVTATSANLSGGADPISAEEVRLQIGDQLDTILDAGPAPIGVASTIVDCSSDAIRVIRQGAVSREDIDSALDD